MRPLLAIAVSAAILGGLALFMQARETPPPLAAPPPKRAARGVYTVEVTPSFSAVTEDAFAPAFSDEPEASALLVQLGGRDVIRETKDVAAGRPLRISPVEGLHEGDNEFYLEAHPPLEMADRAHALRVRVYRDGEVVAEQTVWSEPGLPVQVKLPLFIAPATPSDDHVDHQH